MPNEIQIETHDLRAVHPVMFARRANRMLNDAIHAAMDSWPTSAMGEQWDDDGNLVRQTTRDEHNQATAMHRVGTRRYERLGFRRIPSGRP